MSRTLRILWVAVAALAGCNQKESSFMREAFAKLESLAAAMCECKDKACADKVNEELTNWGSELAKTTRNSPEKPDPILTKKSADIMTKYTECMTRLMTETRLMTNNSAPATPPAPEWRVPPVPKSPTVDTLLEAARESAVSQDKELALASIEARYVRSDGSLDATYGILDVAFGEPGKEDDPSRPIGAPVLKRKRRLLDCPTWTFVNGTWNGSTAICKTALSPTRCNLVQIWKRAIQDAAPPAALATIAISVNEDNRQFWRFSIVDEPRKIHVEKVLPDDCVPVVESGP